MKKPDYILLIFYSLIVTCIAYYQKNEIKDLSNTIKEQQAIIAEYRNMMFRIESGKK